jgi:hypothetical protein
MWSGPRSISTALMDSFRSRPDTEVVDEPLYGHYLTFTRRRDHPGGDDVTTTMETDPDRAVALMLAEGERPIRFLKNMAHHLAGLDMAVLDRMTNVLLTRHPAAVITSLTKQLPGAELDATGLPAQVAIAEHVEAAGGTPIVVDSADILADPRRTLTDLCDRIGIPFFPEMLTWPSGPKPEDGVWAKHWYDNVHLSTGFSAPRPEPTEVAPELEPLLEEAMPLYERLRTYG